MCFSFPEIKVWTGRVIAPSMSLAVSAAVIKHALNLGGKSGHDGGVEEEIETCEDDTADYDSNDNLDAGIDIALTGSGLDGSLCGDDCAVELALDVVNEILHVVITSFFLCLWINRRN